MENLELRTHPGPKEFSNYLSIHKAQHIKKHWSFLDVLTINLTVHIHIIL